MLYIYVYLVYYSLHAFTYECLDFWRWITRLEGTLTCNTMFLLQIYQTKRTHKLGNIMPKIQHNFIDNNYKYKISLTTKYKKKSKTVKPEFAVSNCKQRFDPVWPGLPLFAVTNCEQFYQLFLTTPICSQSVTVN